MVPDDGLQNSGCAVTFVILYYSSVTGALWWLVLAINWFLAAGLKWGREALEARKFIFHTVAWSLPAILTVAALVSRSVEVDELTGVCFAGSRSGPALLAFVIVPLSVVLLVGVGFLLAGLVAMCQIRRDVRSSGERTESLERHMRRVGVFSVMYTIPAACLLACYAYEYASRDAMFSPPSSNPKASIEYHDVTSDNHGLEVKVFTVRIIASLALGVSSGIWTFSCKTLAIWGRACSKCEGQGPSTGVAQKAVTGPPHVNALCSSGAAPSLGSGSGGGCPPANMRYASLPIQSLSSSGSVPLTRVKDPLTGIYLPPSSSGYRSSSGRMGKSYHRGGGASSSNRTCSSLSPPGNFYRLTPSVDDNCSDMKLP